MMIQTAQVRRATIEDLAQLAALWRVEQLPAADLEKRFKEFQVVEEGGKLMGAIGIEVVKGEGLLHHEVFAQPEEADGLREKLLERARMIAGNHGLMRLWTQLSAPFWRQAFQEAPAETRAKLPAAFAGPDRPWLFVQLKDEAASSVSLDKEFALFREAEREQTQKLFQQAKFLKVLALLLGIAVLALVVVWAYMFFQARQQLKRSGAGPDAVRVAEANWRGVPEVRA